MYIRILAVLAGLLAIPMPSWADATLLARVRSAASRLPVEGAVVELFAAGTTTPALREEVTDLLGRARLVQEAGTWDVRVTHPGYEPLTRALSLAEGPESEERYDLVPLPPATPPRKQHFEVTMSVLDARSHTALPEASVVVERWASGDTSGAPEFSRTYRAAGGGLARAVHMQPGHYRFTVNRPGWKELVHPAAGAVYLERAHAAVAALEPERRSLRIKVGGKSPIEERSVYALQGVSVEIEGLAFESDRVVVPARSAETNEYGLVEFADLAPLRWLITARRIGSDNADLIWSCTTQDWTAGGCRSQVVGTGPDAAVYDYDGWYREVNLGLHDTRLTVFPTTPGFSFPNVAASTRVTLRGLEGTPTEGIQRSRTAWAPAGTPPEAVLDYLLPGRYWLRVQIDTALSTSSGFPTSPGPLRVQGTDFKVRSEAVEKLVELGDAEKAVEHVELALEPGVVEGQLITVDALDPEEPAFANYQLRRPMAAPDVEFVYHHGSPVLPEGERVVRVATDAQGRFRVALPPGPWGVRIPSLTTHTAFRTRWQKRATDGTYSWSEEPWPYADPWPSGAAKNDTLHSPWKLVGSGDTARTELVVHRQFLGVELDLGLDDRHDQVLLSRASGFAASYPRILTAPVKFSGPRSFETSLRRSDTGWKVVADLDPGDWTMSLSHPEYEITYGGAPTAPVIHVPSWTAPGIPPVPGPAIQKYPAYRYSNSQVGISDFTARTIIRDVVAPSPSCHNWIASQNMYAQGGCGAGAPGQFGRWYTLDSWPYLLNPVLGIYVGESGCTIYNLYGTRDGVEQWHSSRCDAPAPELYFGGPDANTGPAHAPPMPAADYELELLGQSGDGVPLAGLAVTLGGATVLTGETVRTQADPASASSADPRYILRKRTCEVLPQSPPALRCTFVFDRSITVSGTVLRPDGSPAAGVGLRLADRFGRTRGAVTTNASGAYTLGGASGSGLTSVYLLVDAPGYVPVQKRFQATPPATPDITGADVTLEVLPRPAVTAFELDRFGLFLPGVGRSGDSEGFDPDNARGTLTATWTVSATPTTFTYTADAFEGVEPGVGQHEITVTDELERVLVLDRRVYASRAHRDPQPVDGLAPADFDDPAEAAVILGQLQAGTRRLSPTSTEPFLVAQSVTGEVRPDGSHTGTVHLPSLPTGVYRPIAVAITRHGAMHAVDYELPQGRLALDGLPLPDWTRGFDDIIGTWAARSGQVDVGQLVPAGSFFPLPEVIANIGLDDGYLTYLYGLNVVFQEGMGGPKDGLLSLGTGLMGLGMKGTLQFTLRGREGLGSLTGSATLTKAFADESGFYFPGVLGKSNWKRSDNDLVSIERFDFSGTAGLEIQERLGAARPLDEFRLRRRLAGELVGELRVNLGEIATRIPYVNGPFLALGTVGLNNIGARFLLGVGVESIETIVTTRSLPGGSTTARLQLPTLLGPVEARQVLKLDLLAGAALDWRAPAGLGEVLVGVQLGAPTQEPGLGLEVTFRTDGTAPAIERVLGAVSLVGRVKVNLAGVSLSKSFQHDAIPLDWQPNTAPTFDLLPTGETTTISSPTTSPPAELAPAPGLALANLYPAGAFATTAGPGPTTMAWTDPGPGGMSIVVANSDGSSFGAPQVVATAPGITAVAVGERPGGGRIVAWAELDADGVGDEHATSTVKVAESPTDSGSFGAPVALGGTNGLVTRLQLAATEGGAALLVEDPAGVLSPRRALLVSVRGDTGFGAPTEVFAPDSWRGLSFAASGDGRFALTAVADDGALLVRRFEAGAWSDEEVLASDAWRVTAAFDPDGTLHLVVADTDASMHLHRRASTDTQWPAPVELALEDLPQELQVVSLEDRGEAVRLLAWIPTGAETAFRYAFLEDEGAVLEGPVTLRADLTGAYSELSLSPLAHERAAAQLFVRHTGGDRENVAEYRIVMGEAPTQPDGGSSRPDAGDARDGGTAGETPDGGAEEPPAGSGGCDCGSAPGALALASLLALARRRRPARS